MDGWDAMRDNLNRADFLPLKETTEKDNLMIIARIVSVILIINQ